MTVPIDIKELETFLHNANKSTYANKDAPKVASSSLQSEDYHFEEDSLIYHDTYFGGRDFMGEEIVYKDKQPVWGANYFGFVLDSDTDEQEVYDFLRQALMQEYTDVVPVRGPKEFSIDDKTYTFEVSGNLSNFHGEEEIVFHGATVYRCYVHGGYIR